MCPILLNASRHEMTFPLPVSLAFMLARCISVTTYGNCRPLNGNIVYASQDSGRGLTELRLTYLIQETQGLLLPPGSLSLF